MAGTAIQTQKQTNVLLGGTVIASAILFLTSMMATVTSGGVLTLDTGDYSTVSSGLINVTQSMITILLSFAAVIIAVAGGKMLFRWLGGLMGGR